MKGGFEKLVIAGGVTLASIGVFDKAIETVAGPDVGFMSVANAASNCQLYRKKSLAYNDCIARMRAQARKIDEQYKRAVRRRNRKPWLTCANVEQRQEQLMARYRRMPNKSPEQCMDLCKSFKAVLNTMRRCGYGWRINMWMRSGALSRFDQKYKCSAAGIKLR